MTTADDSVIEKWQKKIGKITWELSREDFPRGDLAALRRLNADAPSAFVFWRMMGPYLYGADDDGTRRWALILNGMALMAPLPRSGAQRIGKALCEADVKEARLARFLNARGRQFRAAVPRLARQLAAKNQPVNWRALGMLILTEGRDERRVKQPGEKYAEKIRMDIARDYYAAVARKAKAKAS